MLRRDPEGTNGLSTTFTDSIRDTETVTIAGAGLAGSLLAVYLARQGFRVELFERWPDPRRADVPAGRSINLALAERGIHALAQVGLHHRVGRFAIPMRGRMVHDRDGNLNLQPYGTREDEVIYSVHRGRLNLDLIEAAEATERVRIHFGQELRGLDLERGEASFHDHASGRDYQRQVLPIIGTDGAGSPTRQAIESYLGFAADSALLDHGYRELTIPPGADGDYRLDPNALHIWPRGGYMMIALPNADRSFTATLFLANGGSPSFSELADFQAFARFIAEQFPDAMPHLTRLEQDFRDNPVGVLGTIRCPHWHVEGRALILGDAAHAVVPFHGQGMNCAFEDVEALAGLVEECDSWNRAFARLESLRRPNANAIADMALENYVEMRASVADPKYVLKRRLALALEQRHPQRFVPRYNMVMFRRIPYAEAQARGRINAEILAQLTRDATALEDVDFDLAARLVSERLAPVTADEGPISLQ